MFNLTNLNFPLESYYISTLILIPNNNLLVSTIEGDIFSIHCDWKSKQYTANFISQIKGDKYNEIV